ncbi:hypothetical protein B0A54_01221 [Friedmanniomyces endolithicus]|uniref:C2H2-type domain-containing protein n=1 Tax=Friedmanniomyces endolithicus TaxID=329885 RepID=A0A4U0VL37_9PEZI|nr:hypothetical protein LTS09_015585 [Friedmanniomyces endolithicus]TKA49145.1 hypothetical protein B0A54_01221 [Friedmanniomyces endolithicus]
MSSSTPSIRVSQHHRYLNSSTDTASFVSSPMAIPRPQGPAPPPLPPPSYIPDLSAGHDPGWQWGNDPNGSDFGRAASVKPGSSLLGDGLHGFRQEQERNIYAQRATAEARRGSSISTVTIDRDCGMVEDHTAHSDEDGNGCRRSSNYRLQSERQLEQRTLEASSNTYDKQLLSRIGGPNTPKRQSVSHSAGLPDAGQLSQGESEGRNGQLKTLSVPERRHIASHSVDSPARSRWPVSGGVSPSYSTFWAEHGRRDSSRGPPTRHGSIAYEDGVSHRNSFDQSMFVNEDLMEEDQMGNLNIHDRSSSGSDDFQPKTGSKRRASSPPRERAREQGSSISSTSGHNEVFRRAIPPHQHSPMSRFHPNHSSISSASSLGPRHSSLGSSLSIASIPSSATSYGSSRLSPGAASPAIDPGLRLGAPYESARTLPPKHQRTSSESTPSGRTMPPDSMTHSQHGSLSRLQGVLICECCPKKPRKFDTSDELRLHESEKQYTCAYCPNRFKNKNEAERHQNSLHLRKHSWSCATLSGPQAAFHQTGANSADVCGYCGDEFSNPPQWDLRAEHLNHVHKFGECNQAKKFFRADHFRQHLKHSHDGTSGKWTNLLEAACMKDEPPPPKRVDANVDGAQEAHQVPPALMVTTTGLGGSANHGVLAETPHDS